MIAIHTLEARNNATLNIAFDNPAARAREIRTEIANALTTTTQQLAARKIDYLALRAALTPQIDKNELALLFNTADMESWYGGQAARAILPHLNRKGRNSILSGDMICPNQDLAFAALEGEGQFWRSAAIENTEQIYVIYITNLTLNAFNAIITGVKKEPWALGYVDCAYAGAAKTIFSTCLATRYVKIGNTFINSHPFDAPENARENGPGWPCADFDYNYESISDLYFDLFLQYKVENLVPSLAFNDGHFSLAAVTGVWGDPRSIPIYVDEAKTKYLSDQKAGSLEKAGLNNLSSTELALKIQNKIASSYIYNLKWDLELNYSTFAALIEFEVKGRKARLRAALRYEDQALALVTLFG